jgi:hypothetical protein
MIRIANRLAFAGLLFLLGCSSNSSSSVPVVGMTFTLQGVVANAMNGARVGDDLKLYLIQGGTVRGPSRLVTNLADPLAGEYAFTGIPVEFGTNNNLWKLVAIKNGYQRFESEFNLKASVGPGGIFDTAYSKIGNIYLFPVGVGSPDYTVSTTYNGKPVGTATVQLDPVSASNSGTFVVGAGDTLTATNGYVASLTQTTDATTGKAIFLGANLAVGAFYTVTVLPVSFKDSAGTTVQLGTFNPPGGGAISFIAGLGVTDIPIPLVKVNAPGAAQLYATGASNRATGQLAADGKLTITLSAPVTLVNPTGFNATLNPAATNAAGTGPSSGVLSTTQPVTATLTDPQTLVLTPNYATAPAATDRGVAITYANGPPGGAPAGVGPGQVVPKDYPALSFSLFGGGLRFSDGTAVSGVVNITGP